ncbi:ComEC family protein [Enterobacter sp. Bisph1]|uniref:ComEC family protein n=1 Tax=Enterobacter sp. Bisph1 TaxID=1274399 RepID=UPI00057C04AA|nr:ComEC family protein [Enterobacter sp. Bisph1]
MTLPALALCIIIGILPLLWLPELPALGLIQALIAIGCLLACLRPRQCRYGGITLLAFAWGILAAKQALWPTEHLPGANRQVDVVITDTDHMTRHWGKITHLDGKRLFPAVGMTFYGQYLPEQVCTGQRWAMTIRARAVHGQLNEGGFDSQRYALAAHLPLSGRFIDASIVESRCTWRANYLQSLTAVLAHHPWHQVILALGMGERSTLDTRVKDIMRQTGTAHLMAISGLHIALAAILAGIIIRGGQFFFPCRWIDWRLPLLIGVGCAVGYAWLTGLQPPAFRTAISLSVWAALRLSGRLWSPWQVWLCCVAAILFHDPLAILSYSLWLSAFAVAALLFWYQWLPLPTKPYPRLVKGSINLFHLQLGMTLLLLPMQIVIFHGISLSALVANLLAIPLVTFVTVPLILLGMLLHLTGPSAIEMACWYLADKTLHFLFAFLNGLPDGWLNVDRRWQWLSLLPWLALIVWRIHLWRRIPALCLAGLALLLFPLWRSERPGDWSVHMLDVGQGLAMVIERNGKAILYDTGTAWPGGNSGRQLIIPWLRWRALQPEGIILSHEHLDHRGGLDSLLEVWPALWIRSPLGWANHQPCFRGEQWQWQGLTFTAHWPLPGTQTKGNNLSCVVRVDDGQYSMLLTGDIEAAGEMAMLSRYWTHLQSTLVQVPHHGSNSSSTLPFVQRVGAEAALASASRYNAWRLPSKKVVERYRQQGYRWYATPHQGQITVAFSPQGWEIHSLRDQLLPRWYHQWFGVPSDNG